MAQNNGKAPGRLGLRPRDLLSFSNLTKLPSSLSTVRKFLNAVNWLCNVICPVGAGIAVVATILQWRSGRSWLPSAMTAGGLICVSGILRLIEYFIAQGQAVG